MLKIKFQKQLTFESMHALAKLLVISCWLDYNMSSSSTNGECREQLATMYILPGVQYR